MLGCAFQTYAPAYVSVDPAALNKKLEAKAKALIALEEQAATTWPKVRGSKGAGWEVIARSRRQQASALGARAQTNTNGRHCHARVAGARPPAAADWPG